ncbi:MAG: hypothetical protein AAF383_03910 [Cyanobacteria bacterium P01_A01_bin.83]
MTYKEKVLIEIQSNFRNNIRGAGLIYMGLYDLINEEKPITPESIAEAIFAPLLFVLEYEYIWRIYTN